MPQLLLRLIFVRHHAELVARSMRKNSPATKWDIVCLDEAQNIKNDYTNKSAAIRGFPANHRIALTGTPMESRLTEAAGLVIYWLSGGSLRIPQAVVLPIDGKPVKRLSESFSAGSNRLATVPG